MILWAAVHLTSDTLCYDLKKRSIEAIGHVTIKYKDKTLHCDKLIFDKTTKQIHIEGKATVEEQKDRYEAYNLQTDLELKTAIADHLNILIDDVLFFKCRRGERNKEEFTFHETYFTTCNTLHPLWGLDVEKIIFNEKENRVYHYNAFIRIHKTRVIPIPYLSHLGPKSKRGRGLLPLFFDPLSGDLGAVLGVPYYIPFSDTNDATITPYGIWSYGLGGHAEYRQNIHKGHFNAEGSTFKRLRHSDELESYYWHANIDLEKKFDTHLMNARLNRASTTDYLKKFWFLHNKGLIYHEPLISSANYTYLAKDGYLNTGLFWIQNRNDKNPRALAPIIEYEFSKKFFRFHTKNFYLEKKGAFSLTKFELYKTGTFQGAFLTAKGGVNCMISNTKEQRQEEFLPFGTFGISYPLLNKSTYIITEPVIIVNLAKPYKQNYDDVFVKPLSHFVDASLFQFQRNTIADKMYHAIFGIRERLIKEKTTLFLGTVKTADDEHMRHFGELTVDPTDQLSLYGHVEHYKNEIPFFETGAEFKASKFNLHGSIAHIKEKEYTQYTLDSMIHLNHRWSLRFGYLGNLKINEGNEHKFLWYATVHYENECLRFELGGSLDRIMTPLRKHANLLHPALEYRILLQIIPKFAKEKQAFRRYLPSSVLTGNMM